jgi:hypothetical protein
VIGVGGFAVLAFVAYRLGWIDLSDKTAKRTGSSSSSIVSIGDEVFAPTRHEAQIEMDRQSMLPAPAPVAGDGDKGIFDGKITINVDRKPANPAGATASGAASAQASARTASTAAPSDPKGQRDSRS